MKGRKAEPAEVKLAKGNPGKRPVHTVPELPGLSLAAPKGLTAGAKRIWEALAPELARLKLLRVTDTNAFQRYCEHLSMYAGLTRDIRKKGVTYVTESAHGTMERIRPAFMVRDRLESRLEALEDRFGLTPMARQQLLQKLSMTPLPIAPTGDQQRRDLFDGQGNPQPAAGETPPPPSAGPLGSPVGLLNRGRLN